MFLFRIFTQFEAIVAPYAYVRSFAYFLKLYKSPLRFSIFFLV
jgi:hypothetical protein